MYHIIWRKSESKGHSKGVIPDKFKNCVRFLKNPDRFRKYSTNSEDFNSNTYLKYCTHIWTHFKSMQRSELQCHGSWRFVNKPKIILIHTENVSIEIRSWRENHTLKKRLQKIRKRVYILWQPYDHVKISFSILYVWIEALYYSL